MVDRTDDGDVTGVDARPPAGRERLAGHDPAAGADTSGESWEGRSLAPSPFAGDDGGSDPRVLAAAQECARLAAAGDDPAALVEAERRLVAALAGSRLLVPVVAVDAEQVDAEDGHEREAGTQMATMTLTAADGRRAFPAFTGVAPLVVWNDSARPVPAAAVDVARSAIEERCDVLLVDLGSEHACVLRLSQVWALAQEREWLPPHADPVVRLAVAESAQGVDGVVRAVAEPGGVHGPGVLRLVLTLRPGLDPARLEAVTETIGARLAGDPEVRSRIDDLAVVLHRAEEPPDTPVTSPDDLL